MNGIFFYFMITEIFTISSSDEIECLCQNAVCQVKPKKCKTNFGCFASLSKRLKDNKVELSKGCLKNEAHQKIICEHGGKPVICCNKNLCNENVTAVTLIPAGKTYASDNTRKDSFLVERLIIVAAVSIFCLIIIVFICYLKVKYRRAVVETVSEPSPDDVLLDQSAGSGTGVRLLEQRTIAKEVSLGKVLFKGRYGEVWKGRWRGRHVAVKTFPSHRESFWETETEIYNLVRHENILVAHLWDIIGKNQQTEFCLVTDYYPLGALYDFLQCHTLDKRAMIKLALSASTGVAYLHSELCGTNDKPSIAHRDIKSKNILVKEDRSCCLADFGLAVTHKYSPGAEVDTKLDVRVGTRRYMAPEVLDNTLDSRDFAAFKKADIYSFGLVLWEIVQRCFTDETTRLCEEYQVPYFDMLPGDPSFDEVKRIVLTEKMRPSVPNRWNGDETLQAMVKLMEECWAHSPGARVTALRVQYRLDKLKESVGFTEHSCDLEEY